MTAQAQFTPQSISAPETAGTVSAAQGERFPRFLGPAIITAYWLINLVVVSTAGNFPLNDDWIYSESVQHLLRTGQFHLLGCSPACFLHVALGAAVCAVTGFSHDHLRGLTTMFGLGTCMLMYGTLLQFGVRRSISLAAVMLLAVNPLFVHLSYSFMTDVPALFLAMLSMFTMVLSSKRNSPPLVVASGAALCAAILVRQTFVAFALVPLAMLVFDRERSKAFQLSLLFAGLLAPAVVAMLAEQCMTRGNQFIAVYAWYKAQFAGTVKHLLASPVVGAGSMIERTFQVFCYFGLFCAPLVSLIGASSYRDLKERNKAALIALSLSALVVVPCFIHTFGIAHKLMPFSNNLLRFPMVGPVNLMGICIAALKTRQKIWLTCVGAALGFVLLAGIVRWLLSGGALASGWHNKSGQDARAPLLAGAFLVAALGTVVIQTIVLDYDRYYLMALPAIVLCLGMLLNRAFPKALWTATVVLFIGPAFYSTAAAQDYMSWNRARWQAISKLEAAGVSPLVIDGGPEYNYLANPELIKACQLSGAGYVITNRGAKPLSDWRWWPVTGEQYIIAFNDVPGYDVVARTPYFGALTWSRREILTLKRSDR